MQPKTITVEEARFRLECVFSDVGASQAEELLSDLESVGYSIVRTEHTSDCALHNAPAYEKGECDCGAVAI